jgi:hypothetical protein
MLFQIGGAMDISLFGPDTHAEVRLTPDGKAEDIQIRKAGMPSMISIPAMWACDVNGTPAQIAQQVSRNLNGARVTLVKLQPIDEA